MQDTRRSFETPEGVELELRLAGPVVRAMAWLMDFGIRVGLYISLGSLLPGLGGLGTGILLICVFVLEWFYPVAFELMAHGATPGKKALGIKVVHDNGTPITWSASLLRNLLRAADFLPLAYGFGLACMMINRDFKRLGDIAAGSFVIYTEAKSRATQLPPAEPLAPPAGLFLPEQRAIVEFAERSRWLSTERSAELAHVLEPLTGKTGAGSAAELYRYASWLHGAGAVKNGDAS